MMDVSERTPRFWQKQLLHFMQKHMGKQGGWWGSQTEAAEQELCVERRKGKWNHWSEAQSRVAERYTLSTGVGL